MLGFHRHNWEILDKTIFTSCFEDFVNKGGTSTSLAGLPGVFYRKAIIIVFKCKIENCGRIHVVKETNEAMENS